LVPLPGGVRGGLSKTKDKRQKTKDKRYKTLDTIQKNFKMVMKRRDFLKSSAAAGTLIMVNSSLLSAKPDNGQQKDITYNTLPL
jgi:secreted PhoX family phosphatase